MANEPNPNFEPPRPEAPFVLELRHEDLKPSGDFRPSAAVLVTDTLRDGGLPQALSAEEFQTLLLVLSCVTANGGFAATPELLAPVAGLSPFRMLGRLRRLASLSWQGEPILIEQGTESGLRLFQPSWHLLDVRRSLVFPAPERAGEPLEIPPQLQESGHGAQGAAPTSREAVIAYSRATYGRPRAEVEARIERFLRGEPEPQTPKEEARLRLRRRLTDVGLTGEQADRLLDAYPAEAIEQQLEWLPHRRARNPAGLLLAAIEGGYEAPPGLKWAWHTDAEDAFPAVEPETAIPGDWAAPDATEGATVDLPLPDSGPEAWPAE